MRTALVLALLSGVPALVYQVVWTRLVALAVAGQIEAISVVVAAFFGGLALGARLLGGIADRVQHPLRFYGALELLAGALALLSPRFLGALGEMPWLLWSDATRLGLAGAGIAASTFLLGGTLPALLRSATSDPLEAARVAGILVGVNTAGAVLGVVTATATIPTLGLRVSLGGAGVAAIALGVAAWALAKRVEPAPERPTRKHRASGGVLLAASLAGVATLAFEVLATRGASLQLGSSLYAWALILTLFLLGLALGNATLARRAARSEDVASDLGWIEIAAALFVAASAASLAPFVATPASGLHVASLLRVVLCVLPAAFLMGGAFPFFVRLGVRRPERLAGSFGAVSAANTAGGIAGALLAPFVLLETLGLANSLLACAALNVAIGVAFLLRGVGRRRFARAALGVALAGLASAPALWSGPPRAAPHVLFVAHGRQATAAVVSAAGRRDLVVDGDPEASTGGDARATEEMLAALALVLHPRPRTLLEIGFGSGITLGTAARFPLERVECVEIADSVLRAAPYFEPDNRGVASGRIPRVQVVLGDGRAYLARHPGAYDIVLANTLHPWSLGATGLYSKEYFERVRAALRPGGLAAQWLPLQRIGAEALGTILRTIISVFPDGDLWWGAGNLIAIGREASGAGPVFRYAFEPAGAEALRRVGIHTPEALARRRLASFETVREVLGAGPVLTDDRPMLESVAALRRSQGQELELAARLARAGAAEDPRTGPLALWVEARAARARGEEARAGRHEILAERAGLTIAREARLDRSVREATQLLAERRTEQARSALQAVLREEPGHRAAGLAMARALLEQGDAAGAVQQLERLVREHADDAVAWNELGIARRGTGNTSGAAEAFARALEADPYSLPALANAGLLALEGGETETARGYLERLRELGPLGASEEERTLRSAVSELRRAPPNAKRPGS